MASPPAGTKLPQHAEWPKQGQQTQRPARHTTVPLLQESMFFLNKNSVLSTMIPENQVASAIPPPPPTARDTPSTTKCHVFSFEASQAEAEGVPQE